MLQRALFSNVKKQGVRAPSSIYVVCSSSILPKHPIFGYVLLVCRAP